MSVPNKQDRKKNKGATKNSPLSSDVSDNAFIYKRSEHSAYKITLQMLKKFWEDSKSVGKNPILILSIPNDKDSDFVLKCSIQIEYKNGANSKK